MVTRPVLVLLGPTASGKTAVSLPLTEALNAEILSIDSRQIYRGMEIGSAAPSPDELARVPHHLVGEVEPTETMSAGEFGRRARAVMDEVRSRGREPLLVGGSGLYLRATLGGLDEDLPRDEAVRERLRERLRHEGSAALHAELAMADPATAAVTSPRDGQRVTRALEILELAGRPVSELRTRGRETDIPFRAVVLDRSREDLETRIRARVTAMVQSGLEEEVRGLLARGIDPASPPLKSVGYAETIRFLRGELDRPTWIEEIAVSTRRFAKRQRTWFRSLDEARWLEVAPGEEADTTAARVRAAWSPGG